MTNGFRLPRVWVGFLLAGLFLATVVIEYTVSPGSADKIMPVSFAVGLGSMVYWLFCVYRIHKILDRVTTGKYPISAARAVGYSFIPFYNLYWLFKWPGEIVNFINTLNDTRRMKQWLPGLGFLFALLALRVEGTLGLVLYFPFLHTW